MFLSRWLLSSSRGVVAGLRRIPEKLIEKSSRQYRCHFGSMETATATTAVTNSFLRDSYLFTLKTRVKEVSVDSADSTILSVLFEDTVFHPQGGGQPSDSGFISIGDDIKLPVLKVTIDREKNTVYH